MSRMPKSVSRVPTVAIALLASTILAFRAEASGWVKTATGAIPVTSLAGATKLGAVPATQKLTIRLGLKIPKKAALLAYLKAASNPSSSAYGAYLTPTQFAELYALSTAQVASAVRYLREAGFTDVVAEPNRLLISANGTAAQAEAAFNTRLERVLIGGKIFYVNTAAAEVPEGLDGIVSAVLGLNSVGAMKSTLALPSAPQYLVSYTPKQFQAIYGVGTTPPGTKTTIAIMAEGNLTGVLKDLRTAEAAFGLPRVAVTVVPVGVASSDVSGADEWDLDSQYSSGMAQNLKMLYLYDTTSLTDSDLALEFSRWASDDKAQAASASLGECEAFPFIDGSMTVDDMIFLEAAAQGQTFFASAGDTGSFCPLGVGENGVPAGAPLVNYPAASPYVIGVGGTTLLTTSTGAYDRETAWYAGGGGVSQFEESPAWQSPVALLLSETGDRGVPDIAMDADPESGALVYVNGAPEGVGGTSLSSPLSLGVWARTLSTAPTLGFGPPHFYSLYDAATTPGSYPKGGYHDITLGANGLYPATPGYDLTTGLGTFLVDEFVKDLAK